MSDFESGNGNNRRRILKAGTALGAGLTVPTIIMRNAWGAEFRNNPGNAKSIKLGFNVPLTGPYADEGADELKAFKLAAKRAAPVRAGQVLEIPFIGPDVGDVEERRAHPVPSTHRSSSASSRRCR